MLQIKVVNTKKDLRNFIFLPEKIHQSHPQWVHPLYSDDLKFFDRKKNKSFHTTDTIMALAWNTESKLVGRIMGIINPVYNKIHAEQHARFCFLECYEDFSIAEALIHFIEEWALKKGMTRLVGPLGFSDKDPQGVLIEGFEERVVIATNYNFPWMAGFIERAGYSKEVDLVSYKMQIPEQLPGFLLRSYERAIAHGGFVMHEFSSRKALKPWIVPIFNLMNEAYSDIYGFIPLSETEMVAYSKRYLPVLNPRFIKVITLENNHVVAFLISMPELSNGIRLAKGRLLPWGWFYILREAKRTRMLTMLLGAISKPYRGKGIDALLGIKILTSAQESGMQIMDSHLILENNVPMRAEYERIGGIVHKRYRIFGKDLV